VRQEEEVRAMEEQRRAAVEAQVQRAQYQHETAESLSGGQPEVDSGDEQAQPFVRDEKKVGRNEPCPCGSGKKYKHCHGTLS